MVFFKGGFLPCSVVWTEMSVSEPFSRQMLPDCAPTAGRMWFKILPCLSRRIGLMQVARGPVQQGQVAVLLFKVVGLFGNLSFQIIV